MDNILKKIETEDIVIYTETKYSDVDKSKYMQVYRCLKEQNTIFSDYSDNSWLCFTGVIKISIDFNFDHIAYKKHFAKYCDLPVHSILDILKCYALCQAGVYILSTIKQKIDWIKDFLTHVGDQSYIITPWNSDTITEYLLFLGMEPPRVNEIINQIHCKDVRRSGQRTLAPLINYLAIANELDELYKSNLENDIYIRWFPLYFWSHVTFIVPLRATEMILTPYHCLMDKDGECYIRLRRSKLKKGYRTVAYSVDNDYELFVYNMPHTETYDNIQKYIALTSNHPRKYLFDYNQNMLNNIFSLECFNKLLRDFIDSFLIGNSKYDYARYACGIDEFKMVSAGDSRPIAMANLYFQGASADICRQLANHMHLQTSAGYYTNVANTVYASSVMRLQNMLYTEDQNTRTYEAYYATDDSKGMHQTNDYCGNVPFAQKGCTSLKRPFETGDISDCIAEDHIWECFGCRYYLPTAVQLSEALEQRKATLLNAHKQVIQYMADNDTIKKREADFDRILLEVHTSIKRYKTACDTKAEEEFVKWHRKKNIQKS